MTWEELCKQINEDTRRDERGVTVHKYDVAEPYYKMPDRGYDKQEALQAFADELVKRIEAEPWRYLQTTIDEMLHEIGVLRQ